MKMCKTFVLVVGLQTSSLRSGSCQFCKRYVNSTYSFTGKSHCYSGGVIDTRSYVEFECEQAVKQGLKIIVLYNFFLVNKRFCPKSIENKGTHVAIRCIKNGKYDWDYGAVRDAFLK